MLRKAKVSKSAEQMAKPKAQVRRIRLRGTRSETWPVTRNKQTAGRNWANPAKPKSSGRWVMAYICQPTATDCISEERVVSKRASK